MIEDSKVTDQVFRHRLPPPGPPIPTAFNTCISVEEQIYFLWDYVRKLREDLETAGVIPKEETL